jgi:hypothetical protein
MTPFLGVTEAETRSIMPIPASDPEDADEVAARVSKTRQTLPKQSSGLKTASRRTSGHRERVVEETTSMMRWGLALAFVVATFVTSDGQEAQTAGPVATSLQPILEVLDKAKLSGSLEFSGRCQPGYIPDFPRIRTPVANGGPLQELREIFADEPAMQVTQDSDGIVRMIANGVSTDLLSTTVSHLSFGEGEKEQGATYTRSDALNTILRAPEMISFMKAHDIDWPFHGGGVRGNPSGQWPHNLPHMSGSLNNVTLATALDQVLKIFPGMWVYEDCPQSDKRNRNIYLGFFYLQEAGGRVFVVQ